MEIMTSRKNANSKDNNMQMTANNIKVNKNKIIVLNCNDKNRNDMQALRNKKG